MPRQRITIAILGLGGQGGGVLADWIVQLGLANGYVTQGTSVPGVAQRTGSTVYYVEMMPADGREPVLALTPVPGDVDIVIASELMEAGRAILRGFVTGTTTLIASTHRIYAIAEKSAMSDGRASSERILAAARDRPQRFVGFDMDAVAASSGSIISSVQFGALAGSAALPFPHSAFEDAIRNGGKAVAANLAGFAAGVATVSAPPAAAAPKPEVPRPTTATGIALERRIAEELPLSARGFATEGVRRLLDYQDAAYAGHYLDRLARLRSVDTGVDDHELTREGARYLALWMAYDDPIRVADLKVRASRLSRVREEVRAGDQVMDVIEYMHPRLEEVCDTLPARLGGWLRASPRVSGRLAPLFDKGRHVETTGLRWFVVLSLLAGMRPWRRGTLRYGHEQTRIDAWLALLADTAPHDPALAIELARCPRLIKGYGDTWTRGLARYQRICAVAETSDAATIRRLREAALADENGDAFDKVVDEVRLAS